MRTFVTPLAGAATWIFLGRVAIALLLGALVGLERQWRQRMAGLVVGPAWGRSAV